MKRRNILQLIIGSIVYLFCLGGTAYAEHPARVIMNFYSKYIPNPNTAEPYIVSILALNEVAHNRHLPKVRNFIDWYFSKLNYPDKYGLTGTVYIYTLENGCEKSLEKYDSVDGYAGIFLHLLYQYVVKTGDINMLHKNWRKIEDIVYLFPFLQDADGLTRALPNSQVKYLMDNCEVYGGVSAYLSLRVLINKGDSEYYSTVRKNVKNGIVRQLYESKQSMFSWAVEKQHKSPASWDVFYPDAYAQLLPIYFEVLQDDPLLRNRLWGTFTQRYAKQVSTFPIEQRIMYELTRQKVEAVNKCD